MLEPIVEKVPAGQLTQLVEPELFWYVPGLQLEHIVDAAGEYEPETQLKHDEMPLSGWYRPAVQVLQLLAPERE